MNCADNTGAKNLYILSVKGIGGRLNRMPQAGFFIYALARAFIVFIVTNFIFTFLFLL